MKGTKSNAPEVPQAFIEMIGDHFLEAARYLREIQDEHPDDFVSVARKLKIGRRKAYALARTDRRFHDLGIAPDRLRRIGWAKLQIVALQIDQDNCEELLDLAETHSREALAQSGRMAPGQRRGMGAEPGTGRRLLFLILVT